MKKFIEAKFGQKWSFYKGKSQNLHIFDYNSLFEHIYKGISLNFDVKYDKRAKFTFRMHKIFLKLNFMSKNSNF